MIDLAIRQVEIAGITEQPHEAYMKQMARNITDAIDGFLLKQCEPAVTAFSSVAAGASRARRAAEEG